MAFTQACPFGLLIRSLCPFWQPRGNWVCQCYKPCVVRSLKLFPNTIMLQAQQLFSSALTPKMAQPDAYLISFPPIFHSFFFSFFCVSEFSLLGIFIISFSIISDEFESERDFCWEKCNFAKSGQASSLNSGTGTSYTAALGPCMGCFATARLRGPHPV